MADGQNVRVTIAAMVNNQLVSEDVFDEPLIDATYRRYYSRPFVAQASSILVLFQGTRVDATSHTALIDMLNVRELIPWTETATWAWMGYDVPTQDDDVVIPATCCVGLKAGTANTIDLQGELYVLDLGQSATLSTRNLLVHGEGSYFQVGLPGIPFSSTFELALDDDDPGTASEVNALMIHDHGVAEIHGERKTSWVRLAADAPQHSNSIQVDGLPAGWIPGDEIVIASSDRDFNHAEQRTIQSVTPGTGGAPTTITLTSQLLHRHCGTVSTVVVPFQAQPMVLDQRAEVGLLTHNVKVVGRARTPVSPGVGGHIMIHAGPTLSHPGFARFSGVEMENLGRSGQVGRYPIHWHMLLGKGKGQFVKRCSIHHSNLRVATIHGTDHVLFEGNVGHEHQGHGVFLEDGSEENNVIKDNLILGTRLPLDHTQAVLPSDLGPNDLFQNRAPASFWITNPHNTFVGNVAAGSEGTGYWFALPRDWLGQSLQNGTAFTYFAGRSQPAPHPRPRHQTLGLFEGNTCHSSWLGFDVHDSIDPGPSTIDTNVTWRPHTGQTQTISRFVAYACNLGLYTGNGATTIAFDHAVLSDNSWGMALASHDIVRDSAVVRDSGNGLWTGFRPGFNPYEVHALLLYDGAARLHRVHLVGYDKVSAQSSPPYAITAFQGIGAARRRTSIEMHTVTCDRTLAGTGPAWPWLGWQDFQQTPANPDYTRASIFDPHCWAFSIDNPQLGLGQLDVCPAWSTVVGNHPMMLFDPGVVEMPLPSSPLVGIEDRRAYCSPYRFGYLRILCPAISGDQAQQAHANPQFRLRYTRERETQSGIQTFSPYEDPWRVKFSKQMAVVVDRTGEANGVRYRLAWSDPSVQVAPPSTELRLSELQHGDAALIGLENYLPVLRVERATALTSPDNESVAAWDILTQSSNLAVLKQLAVSGYCEEQGILWIRIVAAQGGADAAIQVGTDGLGQVIKVTR